MHDDASTVLTQITNGHFDDSLELIRRVLESRLKAVALGAARQLSVGDTVRFTDRVRPQYLIGVTATVKRVNPTTLVVDLERPIGRFRGQGIRVQHHLVGMA